VLVHAERIKQTQVLAFGIVSLAALLDVALHVTMLAVVDVHRLVAEMLVLERADLRVHLSVVIQHVHQEIVDQLRVQIIAEVRVREIHVVLTA